MRKTPPAPALKIISTMAALLLLASAPSAVADDRVPNQILVELVAGASIEQVAARYNLTILDGIPEFLTWLTEAAPGTDIDALVAQMNLDPEVQEAEPHRRMEIAEGVQRTIGDLDLQLTLTDYLTQPAAQTVHTQQAHAVQQGGGVLVATLDSGMNDRHARTRPYIVLAPGADFARGDGSTRAQPNGIDDDLDLIIDESNHHGTFVAGMIHLAAPRARIMPVRVLDAEGRGDSFSITKGILFAIRHRADVINLSFGMPERSGLVQKAIGQAQNAGIVIVGAAGNRGVEPVDFPSSRSEVICVAAVDAQRVKTPWSSYGPDVDLTAPADAVISTFHADFGRWSGTSFAAPLVSGAAALLLERYPGLTASDVAEILVNTTQPDANGPEFDGLLGYGVLDLEAVANVLQSDRTSLKVRRAAGGAVADWSPVLDATVYDLARGDVANLRFSGLTDVDLGPVHCLADDTALTDNEASPDAARPAPGRAFFYVFRDDAQGNDTSYGKSSDGRSRNATGTDCN